MRIAVWHNLPSGGGKRALYQHVKGLVERSHTVEAWCPPTADQTYLPLNEIVEEHILGFGPAKRKTLFRKALGAYDLAVSPIDKMHEHCRQCADQINLGGFDLLLAGSCHDTAVSPIGRYVDIPKLLYLQEPFRQIYEASPKLLWSIMPEEGARTATLAKLRKLIHNEGFVYGMRKRAGEEALNAYAYDTLLVNSYFSRESILRTYGRDAKVCYLGIDTDLFEERQLPKEELVIGLGALHEGKDHAFLIRAVAAICNNRPQLLLIGNSSHQEYVAQLKQLALDLNVRLEIKTRVSDNELVACLSKAFALLYAPHLEPFGFAPLEANSCRLPVIAVAEGGIRETVIDGMNGLLVDHEPEAMARAVERLQDDRAFARRLGDCGRTNVVERWSWPTAIDRLEHQLRDTFDAASGKKSDVLPYCLQALK